MKFLFGLGVCLLIAVCWTAFILVISLLAVSAPKVAAAILAMMVVLALLRIDLKYSEKRIG